MTKTEILQEQTRLRVYKLDLETNLPSVILDTDNGYKMANKRLSELSQLLVKAEKVEATQSAEQQMKEAKSTEVLGSIIKDFREVVAISEAKQKDLTPSCMGRYFDILKSVKQELR